MANRFMGSILGVVAVFAISPGMLAQTTEQSGTAKATPDLSGIWQSRGGFTFNRDAPPMHPWAEDVFHYNRNPENPNGHGRNEVDPQIRCIPRGIPRIWLIRRPVEFIQVPGRVIILYERNHMVRHIWMDEEHPENYPSGFLGHSTGRWDGDTLVIDTVGLRAGWLDGAGHLQSDALHVVERIRRVDHDTIQIDFTFEDPKMYTKPWTGSKLLTLEPELRFMEDHLCEDPLGRGGA